MINNYTDYSTCATSLGILFIYFVLTNPKFGLLWVREIPKKYSLLLDHKMILLEWKDLLAKELGNQAAITS